MRVLSRLYRRLFLESLQAAFEAAALGFFGDLAHVREPAAFAKLIAQARQIDWVVYAKPPFGGPEQVLAYLGRYTHRVAIANSRLVDIENDQVAFRWKDYRHHDKAKVMTLAADEFIRRFLLHILPDAFHRIRHYGFLANGHRAAKLARCRRLLAAPTPQPVPPAADYREQYLRLTGRSLDVCPCCGGRMITLGATPRCARLVRILHDPIARRRRSQQDICRRISRAPENFCASYAQTRRDDASRSRPAPPNRHSASFNSLAKALKPGGNHNQPCQR